MLNMRILESTFLVFRHWITQDEHEEIFDITQKLIY